VEVWEAGSVGEPLTRHAKEAESHTGLPAPHQSQIRNPQSEIYNGTISSCLRTLSTLISLSPFFSQETMQITAMKLRTHYSLTSPSSAEEQPRNRQSAHP
jgi:hypothetical protein